MLITSNSPVTLHQAVRPYEELCFVTGAGLWKGCCQAGGREVHPEGS